MKTIKEKYKEIVSGWNDERTENVSKRCEEIADNYAIEFAEWLVIRYNEDIIYDEYTTDELLEIFKKEKGL